MAPPTRSGRLAAAVGGGVATVAAGLMALMAGTAAAAPEPAPGVVVRTAPVPRTAPITTPSAPPLTEEPVAAVPATTGATPAEAP